MTGILDGGPYFVFGSSKLFAPGLSRSSLGPTETLAGDVASGLSLCLPVESELRGVCDIEDLYYILNLPDSVGRSNAFQRPGLEPFFLLVGWSFATFSGCMFFLKLKIQGKGIEITNQLMRSRAVRCLKIPVCSCSTKTTTSRHMKNIPTRSSRP